MEQERETSLADDWYRESLQNSREIGLLAIKTLITLNSGSIVVLLTFVSNAGPEPSFTFDLDSIKSAFFCFLGGLVFSALLVALAYGVALTANPFSGESNVRVMPASWIEPCYFSFAVASFICFCVGVLNLALNITA